MVAIFVVLTIVIFLLIDYAVQKIQARHTHSSSSSPVHVGAEAATEKFMLSAGSITVPSAIFFHRGHTWIKFTSPNRARVGLDDFAQKVLGRIEAIQFPRLGESVRQGEPLFMVCVGHHKLFLPAPSEGIVTHLNTELASNPKSVHSSPYERGWICEMKPENISKNIRELLSEEEAVRWELHELNKLQHFLNTKNESQTLIPEEGFSLGRSWAADCERPVLNEFSKSFFALDLESSELLTEAS